VSLARPTEQGDLRVLTLSSKNRKLSSKRDIR
jgi:hypothetical protein